MKAKGNSDPQLCATNLLRISRGEVPYDRIKGLSISNIDRPAQSAASDTIEDAVFVLENYEPRIDANSIDIKAIVAETGDFLLSTNIKINQSKEGEPNA